MSNNFTEIRLRHGFISCKFIAEHLPEPASPHTSKFLFMDTKDQLDGRGKEDLFLSEHSDIYTMFPQLYI